MGVTAANSSYEEMNATTVQPEAGIMTRDAYLFAGGIASFSRYSARKCCIDPHKRETLFSTQITAHPW